MAEDTKGFTVIHNFLKELESREVKYPKNGHMKGAEGKNMIRQYKALKKYPLNILKKYSSEIIQAYGGPGTILIFNQNILHKLPSFVKPGREVLWFKYFPEKTRTYAVNHLYKQSILSKLTDKQLSIYCIGKKINNKKGITQLAENNFESGEHKISKLKMYLYYLRFNLFKLFR